MMDRTSTRRASAERHIPPHLTVLEKRPATGRDDGREETPDYPKPFDQRTGRLWDALREVMDPEIPVSLVDLGLIYDIRQEGGAVEIDLTFTATACPCMFFIKHDIEEQLLQLDGVDEVSINEVWSPAWTNARISPEGREQMRKFGVAS